MNSRSVPVLQTHEFVELISYVKNYPGILRKRDIHTVTSLLKANIDPGNWEVTADYGEDAAVLVNKNSDMALLLAADGIMDSLLEADPFFAGYCSVLVNVNDIYAMGGTPIAMVDVLSSRDGPVKEEILKGIRFGCEKFGVPMVGGHYHPHAQSSSLSVTILGSVDKNNVIYSSRAQIGNVVILGIDIDGSARKGFSMSFDSTSSKEPGRVRDQLFAMSILSQKSLLSAGKDISNPGLLGTLGMLLESSGCGAEVWLDSIPVPGGIELNKWLCMYPGCGFVLTCPGENELEVLDILGSQGLVSSSIGRIMAERKLLLRKSHFDSKTWELFDLSKKEGGITGLGLFN